MSNEFSYQNISLRAPNIDHPKSAPITQCTCTISGVDHVYHACSTNESEYTDDCFVYLGKGVIKEVNGVPQLGKQELHFWADTTKAPKEKVVIVTEEW